MNETCPHCLRSARFDVAAQVAHGDLSHQIQTCQACQGLVYRAVDFRVADGQTVAQWPLKEARPPHSAVPAPIGADSYEAHLCMSIGAFRAAAVMARRAVQGIAIAHNAQGKRLVDQLKSLKDNLTLHPTLIDWADHIRLLGNAGAHPGDDGLESVSETEARDVVRFLDELLRWAYELPAEMTAARAAGPNSTPAAPAQP